MKESEPVECPDCVKTMCSSCESKLENASRVESQSDKLDDRDIDDCFDQLFESDDPEYSPPEYVELQGIFLIF